jgi:hypothetical protein
MRRWAAGLGILLFALLGMPHRSEAGLIELIWEMSGPRMLGAGFGCTYTLKGEREDCRLASLLHGGKARQAVTRSDPHGPLVFVGGSYFFSTGHDSKTQEYDWFGTHMLAVEPGLKFRSKVRSGTNIRVSHGAGVSYDFLFGQPFRRFTKLGFTLTPIELEYKRVAVGFIVRIYPDGFKDDEFRSGRRVDHDGPSERLYGVSATLIFGQ